MSNYILPTTVGLAWDVKKSPKWNTIVQTPAILKNEVRIAVGNQPQYMFEMSYEFLRQSAALGYSELQAIEGFYNARQGSFQSFLINLTNFTTEAADSVAVGEPFQQDGDGTTTLFKISRNVGWLEQLDAFNPTGFQLYVDGTLTTTGFTTSPSTGWITFATAPTSGAALTWSGTFYYRVRFADDPLNFSLFQQTFWELQQMKLVQTNT